MLSYIEDKYWFDTNLFYWYNFY